MKTNTKEKEDVQTNTYGDNRVYSIQMIYMRFDPSEIMTDERNE